MYCIVFLIIFIIYLCKSNNLEFFNNFYESKCLKSQYLTNQIKCKKNQYCINNCNLEKILHNCGDNNFNEESIILNNSNLDKDINNRRLLNHLYSTFEINSELNTSSWCN